MNGQVTWEVLYAVGAFALAALGLWWRIESSIDKSKELALRQVEAAMVVAKKQHDDLNDQNIMLAKDLADYKLLVSDRFASNQDLKDVEIRLTTAVNRLADQIEKLPDKFVEEVARLLKPVRRS